MRASLVVLVSTLLLVLAGPGELRPQFADSITVTELAAFDRAVRSLMSVHGLPGASLAVARDERLVLARAYGHADTVGRERMRPNHRFRIASVSKPVTAAAVLKLVEDGELRLGDRAFAFLDQLEPPAGATVDPRFREITIRQLLRHRAGFDRTRGLDPTLTPGRVAAELGVGLPVEVEQVIRFMLGRPLDFDPGTKTVYSNFGYAVLGRVVERVTGRDYEAYVREAILRPAGATGMELGQAFPTDRPADEVSYYHPPPPGLVPAIPPGEGQVPLPDGGFDLSVMDAHGGWIASAPDLLRFLTAIDGSPRRPDVLSPATVRRMTAPPNGEPVDTAHYAMGWDVRPAADGRPEAWWHAGDLPGTTALLMRSGRTAWALLLNGTAWGPEAHAEIRGALEAAARRVEAWPVHDLFARGGFTPGSHHFDPRIAARHRGQRTVAGEEGGVQGLGQGNIDGVVGGEVRSELPHPGQEDPVPVALQGESIQVLEKFTSPRLRKLAREREATRHLCDFHVQQVRGVERLFGG